MPKAGTCRSDSSVRAQVRDQDGLKGPQRWDLTLTHPGKGGTNLWKILTLLHKTTVHRNTIPNVPVTVLHEILLCYT